MWVEDPFLVERLRTEPAVAQVLDWYDRIDVLVTGIGSWNPPVSCLHNAFSETWRRQVLAGGVRADGEKVGDKGLHLAAGNTVVLQVGKRKFARITLT